MRLPGPEPKEGPLSIELSVESLEIILVAMKAYVRARKADGLPPLKEEDLIARLEAAEREQIRNSTR